MSESDFSIWDEKTNKLVRKIWTERQNYEVCINNNDDRRCFIFFSSWVARQRRMSQMGSAVGQR